MYLSKDQFGQMAWHMAAGEGHLEVLEILCDWAKQLQLKPEEIRKDVYLSKPSWDKRPGTWQLKEATLKYYRNC